MYHLGRSPTALLSKKLLSCGNLCRESAMGSQEAKDGRKATLNTSESKSKQNVFFLRIVEISEQIHQKSSISPMTFEQPASNL